MRRFAFLATLAAAGVAIAIGLRRPAPEFSFDETHWWGVGAA